jgi:BMFP domain-containing protein YqiC
MHEIWETFDDLYHAFYRQGRRVAELEARLAQLEKNLTTRAGNAAEKALSFPKTARPKLKRAA